MIKIFALIVLPFLLYSKTFIITGGENNTVQEIAYRIIEKAYHRAHLNIQPLYLPLEKSLIFSNSDQSDGEMARIEKITHLYPNLKIVPVNIISAQAVAFSKNKSLKIKNWNDLKGHRVTVVKGAKFIEKATQDINTSITYTFEEAFEKLNNNETEIIVIPKLAGYKMQYVKKYSKIRAVSKSLKTIKLYHFVTKKNSYLIPILTPILQQMKDSGEMNYIRSSYLNSLVR